MLVTDLLQYHDAVSVESQLVPLHWTKYLVNTSEQVLSFADIASQIHDVQLFAWKVLIAQRLFTDEERGVGVGVFVAPCVMVTFAPKRHRT